MVLLPFISSSIGRSSSLSLSIDDMAEFVIRTMFSSGILFSGEEISATRLDASRIIPRVSIFVTTCLSVLNSNSLNSKLPFSHIKRSRIISST